jgi:hypothetical protein
MAYEVYKNEKTKEGYFGSWKPEEMVGLTEDLKNEIYKKYLIKCRVLKRDGFKCQNVNCKYPDSKLTLHHIKWQKNKGEDKIRNGVTLCKTCHGGFHKAKNAITFPKSDHLPPHISGKTFKLDKPDRTSLKKLRKDMRNLRRQYREYWGFRISWEDAMQLMIWAFEYHEHGDD